MSQNSETMYYSTRLTPLRHHSCCRACCCGVILLLSVMIGMVDAGSNATMKLPAKQQTVSMSASGDTPPAGLHPANGTIDHNKVDDPSRDEPINNEDSVQLQGLNKTPTSPDSSQPQHQLPVPANITVKAPTANSSNTGTAGTSPFQRNTSSSTSRTTSSSALVSVNYTRSSGPAPASTTSPAPSMHKQTSGSPPAAVNSSNTSLQSPIASPAMQDNTGRSPPAAVNSSNTSLQSPTASPAMQDNTGRSPPAAVNSSNTSLQSPTASPAMQDNTGRSLPAAVNSSNTSLQSPIASPANGNKSPQSPSAALSSNSTNLQGPTASPALQSNKGQPRLAAVNSSTSWQSPTASPAVQNQTAHSPPAAVNSSSNNSSLHSPSASPAIQDLPVHIPPSSAVDGSNTSLQSPVLSPVPDSQNQTQQPSNISSSPSPSPAPPATSPFKVDYSKVRRSGSEISTSVLIYGFSDMEGEGYSMCERAVNNSLGFYARKINYVLTVFAIWGNRTIDSYYFKDRSDYTGHLVPVTNETITRWQAGLTRCFKAGVNAGFTTVHIVLHVNFISEEMHGKSLWRNGVKFDPAAKYGPDNTTRFNYSDILLHPAAEALNSVVTNETIIEMALGGEQGLSVFGYPQAYLEMTEQAKAMIPNAKTVLTGVSFNYDKVCGCVEPEERDPILYNNTYPDRFLKFKETWGFTRINLTGVKELLWKSDFIGLSSYSPLPANLTHEGIESAIQTAAFEFLYFGIDLKRLLFVGKKQLIFSEQGLGGLTDNARLPPSLDYIRKHPYSGAGPAYSDKLDPWKIAEYRDFRRHLYGVLTSWAAAGGGPQYKIDGIFIWSMGTWDVHAAHPLSLGRNASYGDPVIQYLIRRTNAWVNREYLDEIASIKPLINGTREYIQPPWLRRPAKPQSPPAPAPVPSPSPAIPAARLPGQGYCAAPKPVTSPNINATKEPLQKGTNAGCANCMDTQTNSEGLDSTSAGLKMANDSKLVPKESPQPVLSQPQVKKGADFAASPASWPVQTPPQDKPAVAVSPSPVQSKPQSVAVSPSPVQAKQQDEQDLGVAASPPPVQSQQQTTSPSPSPVQAQPPSAAAASPSPVQAQPPSAAAASSSPVQAQPPSAAAASPSPVQAQPPSAAAASPSPVQAQLPSAAAASPSPVQAQPPSAAAASSSPVQAQPPSAATAASASPVQAQPPSAATAASPSPVQAQPPSAAVSPSPVQAQQLNAATSMSPVQAQQQDVLASPSPLQTQPSSGVASASPAQAQPPSAAAASPSPVQAQPLSAATSMSPVQAQQQDVLASPSPLQTQPSSGAASASPAQAQPPSAAAAPSDGGPVQAQQQDTTVSGVATSPSPAGHVQAALGQLPAASNTTSPSPSSAG